MNLQILGERRLGEDKFSLLMIVQIVAANSSISVLTEINIFSELLHSQEGLVSFFKLSSFANATRF